ncbi:MAG: peptidoglycan DD-metalloendopeptidase family protein [Woeseiaceae bacterium]
MHRPASPLLHDYKHAAPRKPGKSRALQWFAVGLGLPLLGLAMISAVGSRPSPMPDIQPALTATPGAEVDVHELADADKVYSDVPLVLAPQPEYQKLTLTIHKGDTLDQLFRKNQLDIGDLVTISRLDEAGKRFRRIKPGDTFEITHDEGKVVSMYSPLDLTSALEIDRSDSGFKAQIEERPIEKRKRFAYGLIKSSLFQSAADAGLSDKTIMNLAGIFAWDVDFVLDIRSGDNFYVEWEEIWQDGKLVTDGDIIAAEFNNDGRTYRAVRFVDDSGRADYYTPDGHSVRKAFIRAPVDFTRISSNFNLHRKHPILNTIRAHKGVDYAAPKGTPIKAAGDGKVIFRGVKGGYGNAVILQHGGNITTLYGHMSRFASGVGVGTRVRQGQTIGYVGSTGLATANHLHYEYRINGVHRNPRTVQLPQADPIPSQYRDKFFAASEPILAELDHFKSTQLASVAYADEASH